MNAFKVMYRTITEERIENGKTTKEVVSAFREYKTNMKEINLRMVEEAKQVVKGNEQELGRLKASLIAKLDEVDLGETKGKTFNV